MNSSKQNCSDIETLIKNSKIYDQIEIELSKIKENITEFTEFQLNDLIKNKFGISLKCHKTENDLFQFGKNLLFCFIYQNWLDLFNNQNNTFFNKIKIQYKNSKFNGLDLIAKNLCLLQISQAIFRFLIDNSNLKTKSKYFLWLGRTLLIQQALIDDNLPELKKEALSAYNSALIVEKIEKNEKLNYIELEAACVYLKYWEFKKFNEIIEKLKTETNFRFTFEGAMAILTKFQTKPTPHIRLKIHHKCVNLTQNSENSTENSDNLIENNENSTENNENLIENNEILTENNQNNQNFDQINQNSAEKIEKFVKMPKKPLENEENCQKNIKTEKLIRFVENVLIDDENALEEPKFEKYHDCFIENFNFFQLFSQLLYFLLTRPKEKLYQYEMQAIISKLINSENCPPFIHLNSLYIRSLLEIFDFKRAFRALNQIEKITYCKFAFCEKNDIEIFLNDFWICLSIFPPKWKREIEYAEINIKAGMFKTALDIMEKFPFWEPVVKCLINTDNYKMAKEIIEKQLKTQPKNAKLHLNLGKITQNEQHLQKAWELSNETCYESQILLGEKHFSSKSWKIAENHYKNALEINYLLPEIWLKRSYCFKKIMDRKNAIKCLIRCVNINSENYKAWNDLAALFLEEKNYKNALFALKDSIRLNNKVWRVWDNYLTCCIALKQPNGCLKSLAAIIELCDSVYKIDERALEILKITAKNSPKLQPKIELLINKIIHGPKIKLSTGCFAEISEYYKNNQNFKAAIEFKRKQIRLIKQFFERKTACFAVDKIFEHQILNEMLKATEELEKLCVETGHVDQCDAPNISINQIKQKIAKLNDKN